MEGEKNRKRKRDGGGGAVMKAKAEAEVDPVNAESPQPSEEDVEEFWAILRNMRVAINYFEKSNGGNGRWLSERGLGTALKTETMPRDDGVRVRDEAVQNVVLDLNAVPECESSNL